MNDNQELLVLSADIVAAHLSNNAVPVSGMEDLISQVHGALAGLASGPVEKKELTPAVSVRSSLKPAYLVCLECGTRHQMLRRHLKVAHGLTPETYRSRFRLPASYPVTAPDYSELRSRLAKESGLGRGKRPDRGRKGGTGKARTTR